MNHSYDEMEMYRNLELSKRVALGNENLCFEEELFKLCVERSNAIVFFELLLFIDICY
jgi:hypothetical protein